MWKWKVTFNKDLTNHSIQSTNNGIHPYLLKIEISLSSLLEPKTLKIIQSIQEKELVLISLCDHIARQINNIDIKETFRITTLDNPKDEIPFILERSDVFYNNVIHIHCRLHSKEVLHMKEIHIPQESDIPIYNYLSNYLSKLKTAVTKKVLEHVSCIVLQERLRDKLSDVNGIAFIANGSILPRKHSSSYLPMTKNVIPFEMNEDSCMCVTLSVDMGCLSDYLDLPQQQGTVKLKGLLVNKGITLIVGGAYHGKSTLLTTISYGIYNKTPSDGRQYCVTSPTALNVRSEDGRYVAPYTNISAFLKDLPMMDDTSQFHTSQASGSTSMASNVMEGIELMSNVFLIDEDLSATNFMSRDGRMRALIANESLTPLLYRINAIYNTFDISSIVVIGGVGDWLDVPHNVLLLDKYNVKDVTKKAKSISETFSYGHVQYAGRGVVHRLEWDECTMNPYRRCIHHDTLNLFCDSKLSLGDGKNALALIPKDIHHDDNEEYDQIGCIDVHRCQQMLDLPYIHGCALCMSYIINKLHNEKKKYDLSTIMQLLEKTSLQSMMQNEFGYVLKPRSMDVMCMLMRMRGVKFEVLPDRELEEERERQRLEKERKAKELMDLWNSRR